MPITQAAQGLGRVFDVLHDASGNMVSMKNANAISFLVKSSGAASLAIVAAKTFSGSTTTWTTNSVALAGTTGYTSVFTIYATQFADGFDYIQATGTNTTTCIALLHDLAVMRTPANLVKLGA